MKGLDQFLAKIRETPRPTLVNRFLALIAELPSEEEKTRRALDLAEALIKGKPAETLRLAHMVHTADRFNLRALDLMIDAMVARGRVGKAEVLRNEKAKIEKEMAETPEREPSARLPQALFDPVADGVPQLRKHGGPVEHSQQSRIAGIDLGQSREEIASPSDDDALSRLFHMDPVFLEPGSGKPTPAPATAVVPSPISALNLAFQAPREDTMVSDIVLRLDMIAGMPEHKPVDTVLPLGGSHDPGEAGPASTLQKMFAPTVSLTSPGRDYGIASAQAPAMIQTPSPASSPESGAPSEPASEAPTPIGEAPRIASADAFDHNWRLGYVNEAREVLRMASGHAHEPWWQARHAVVERALKVAPVAQRESAPLALVTEPASTPDFWQGIQSELARLQTKARTLLVPFTRVERVERLLPKNSPLPAGLARQIAEIDHRLPGLDEVLVLKWDLIQGLWGDRPDARLAELLEELGLTAATHGFFGIYLDALLEAGKARRALVVAQRVLKAKPQLSWAKVAWARLPRMFAALRVHDFSWSEDEGVPVLLAQLGKRPRPKLQAVIPAPRRA